jgi:hypothetical protein
MFTLKNSMFAALGLELMFSLKVRLMLLSKIFITVVCCYRCGDAIKMEERPLLLVAEGSGANTR